MHSVSVSLVRGLTSPAIWVCAFIHPVLKFTAWAKSMRGWCFNIKISAQTAAFDHAWCVRTCLFTRLQRHIRLFLSLHTPVIYFHLSVLVAQIWLHIHTHQCVYIPHKPFSFWMQHAPLHITHQCHLSIQQQHSLHTWMHAGIHAEGSEFTSISCLVAPLPQELVPHEFYDGYTSVFQFIAVIFLDIATDLAGAKWPAILWK